MYGTDLVDPTSLDSRLAISNPYDVPFPCITEGASDHFLLATYGIQNLIIHIKVALTGIKPQIGSETGFASALVLVNYDAQGKKGAQSRAQVPLTGDFGEGLKRLIYQFQADSGLDPDGIIGPSTYKALLGDRFSYHPCGEMPPAPPQVDLPEVEEDEEEDLEVTSWHKKPSTYILLILLGVGGYYGYKYYQRRF